MTTTAQPAATSTSAGNSRNGADLVCCGSIEMGAHRPQDARAIASLLPSGTPVYVNHLPRHSLDNSIASLLALRDSGLEPVPHIAARRIKSRSELESFLRKAVDSAGVRKVLLIGGDETEPQGPYSDAITVLDEGLLEACGVREVGLAGYPEGHTRIPKQTLEMALARKLDATRSRGLGAFILTQFSFAPARVVDYCADLARRAPGTPVYVGFAGPTDPIALLRFAQRCGVSASLRALRAQGFGAAKLVTHTDPAEQLAAVARYCASHADCNVVGIHLFSFGGVDAAARWMNRYISSRGGD